MDEWVDAIVFIDLLLGINGGAVMENKQKPREMLYEKTKHRKAYLAVTNTVAYTATRSPMRPIRDSSVSCSFLNISVIGFPMVSLINSN